MKKENKNDLETASKKLKEKVSMKEYINGRFEAYDEGWNDCEKQFQNVIKKSQIKKIIKNVQENYDYWTPAMLRQYIADGIYYYLEKILKDGEKK